MHYMQWRISYLIRGERMMIVIFEYNALVIDGKSTVDINKLLDFFI